MRKNLRTHKRIERDKQLKQEKMIAEMSVYNYNSVFTYLHFVYKLKKCIEDVSWKASVQNYYLSCIVKMFNDYLNMADRRLPLPVSDREVTIRERGKERKITPIHIKDRMIQKVLCDEALVPVLSSKLIYDNGASLKGKGVVFTRNRMLEHLRKAIKSYGTDFYVLSFDFKSFFDSVPHKTCRMMLERYFADTEIIEVTMDIIKLPHLMKIKKIKDVNIRNEELRKLKNDEYCGICLGSQVSQIMALVVANDLDHYIKDVMRVKHYVRYMDDGKIFAKTKEELQELFAGMLKICDKLGLVFNTKKTHITKISEGFTFLKVKYYVTSSGKIIRKLTKGGTVRMRHKLKKLKLKFDNGMITLDDVYNSMQSWLAHSQIANSYITTKNMLKLYNELFDGYKLTKKWEHCKGGYADVLQANTREKYCWGYIA